MNLKANELLESECGATCYVQSKGFIACKDEKCRTSCDLFVHFHPAEKYLHSTHLWLEWRRMCWEALLKSSLLFIIIFVLLFFMYVIYNSLLWYLLEHLNAM